MFTQPLENVIRNKIESLKEFIPFPLCELLYPNSIIGKRSRELQGKFYPLFRGVRAAPRRNFLRDKGLRRLFFPSIVLVDTLSAELNPRLNHRRRKRNIRQFAIFD
jgi:hypothetical protein